ncbi:hypothetical protein BEWA_040150 [Theileria equi strain WA]|uniref:Signal peptide containing protein n=1 Tax=Theileria equi strain WA TaxID=1537102 RepID=L1LEV5_THEEQ|nr:hypothetical protein BEWA_040150 [Theileria equi strain WA]EKX73977.1 hypothetical protein BEWA_040150 [Theileria equi strain WA]|eukprot:XP_004833429.1 hypothetical protein BEWA_040150 [Theileria equi strain WA]
MLMMGVYRKTPLLVTGFLVGAVVVYQVTYSLRDKTKDVVPAPKAPAVAPVVQPNQAGDANLRGAEEDGITIQFEKTEGYTTHGNKITVQKRENFPVAGFSRHSHIGKLSLPLVIKKFSFEDKTLKGIPSDLNVINSSVYFKTGLKEPVLVELYKYSPDGHNTSVHFFTKGANETWEEFFFGANLSLTKKLNELTGGDAKKAEADQEAGGEVKDEVAASIPEPPKPPADSGLAITGEGTQSGSTSAEAASSTSTTQSPVNPSQQQTADSSSQTAITNTQQAGVSQAGGVGSGSVATETTASGSVTATGSTGTEPTSPEQGEGPSMSSLLGDSNQRSQQV